MNAVIFAGGVGTRLWPLSRKKSPKQFEKIIGNKSTLQLAAERLQPDFPWDHVYVATGRTYVPIVQEQLPKLPPTHVIGEPEVRDVGPAVGLMAAILARESSDEPMAILWSDHLVRKDALFRKILRVAGEYIHGNPEKIIFVAQKPRFPSENLGWIEYGESLTEKEGIVFHAFIDCQYRPGKETAQRYFESGHHGWNLGYFVTSPRFLLALYERFVPNVYAGLERIAQSWHSGTAAEVLERVYPTLEKISFDNAILEKLDPSQALVISENIEWSDIGAWEALKEALEEAEEKNVTQGKVMLNDTQDSLVYNYTDQLVVTIDLDDMLIVNTGDVVLVCKKGSVSKIKKLVERMTGTQNDHLT
ncbi:NTP transferase domain-containing protein [Candidatus Gottesmanbacteria bacterium]|nr:NTP transferase domain-containing protein [Candidatus Gottesmanbacteria bacterium]